ncbi:MAG: peptide chain release factor N(5)-glutamine methyltransferase [Flavobacteriales bacterium]
MEVSADIRKAFTGAILHIYNQREADTIYRWCLAELNLPATVAILKPAERKTMEKWLAELKTGKPVQYVLGNTVFYGRKFLVTPDVLIPRPETEELCHYVIKSVPANSCIMDVGTGSGCIAITLSKELPKSKVMASDVSAGALKIARSNAKLNKATVEFMFHDALNTPVPGEVTIIVSNPPYIPVSEKADMPSNVVHFEPHQALFVENTDPLLFYRQLVLLNPFVDEFFFEIHESKKPSLEEFLSGVGINNFTFHKDLQEKDRILHIKR